MTLLKKQQKEINVFSNTVQCGMQFGHLHLFLGCYQKLADLPVVGKKVF